MTIEGVTAQETTKSAPPAGTVSGRVRVDDRVRRLASRLEAGDVAVIDQMDLDRETARVLVAAGPAVVLNAAPSTSGRHPNRGPEVLLEAGVPLVDDLGPDVMALREGERVDVELASGRVLRAGALAAQGRPVGLADAVSAREAAQAGLRAQLDGFAASAGEFLEREAPLLLHGVGLPDLVTRIAGRTVLVVLDDSRTTEQLRAARAWLKDTHPLVIGVDGGADIATDAGWKPRLIIGDMDVIRERTIRSGAELVVRAGHDALAPGRERLERMGIDHHVMTVSGSSADAAILLAALSGAEVIVTVGERASLDDFLDRGRGGMSASFFTRLRATGLIVPLPAIAATHRPRLRGGWILLMLLAALLALGTALAITPWGAGVLRHLAQLAGMDAPAVLNGL